MVRTASPSSPAPFATFCTHASVSKSSGPWASESTKSRAPVAVACLAIWPLARLWPRHADSSRNTPFAAACLASSAVIAPGWANTSTFHDSSAAKLLLPVPLPPFLASKHKVGYVTPTSSLCPGTGKSEDGIIRSYAGNRETNCRTP